MNRLKEILNQALGSDTKDDTFIATSKNAVKFIFLVEKRLIEQKMYFKKTDYGFCIEGWGTILTDMPLLAGEQIQSMLELCESNFFSPANPHRKYLLIMLRLFVLASECCSENNTISFLSTLDVCRTDLLHFEINYLQKHVNKS